MMRGLVTLGVVCLAASLAAAGSVPQLQQTWTVDKDQAIALKAEVFTPGSYCNSRGSSTDYRFARWTLDGAWYGDWTNANKDAIQALLDSDPTLINPAATGWELRFEFNSVNPMDMPETEFTGNVAAWKARTDLPEMIEVEVEPGVFQWQADDTYPFGNNTWAEYGFGPGDEDMKGACNESPDINDAEPPDPFPSPQNQWMQFDGTPVDVLVNAGYFGGYTGLFGLPGGQLEDGDYVEANTRDNDIFGFKSGSDPWRNSVLLDADVIAWILDTSEDNYVQGLMMQPGGSTWFDPGTQADQQELGAYREYDHPTLGALGPRLAVYILLNLLPGDTDGDGNVDLDDMIVVAQNWGTGTTWAEGDFDQDGDVDKDDLELLARNWTGVTAAPTGLVPEPATVALLGLGALGAFARRRRR